jgi:hypothetical protein
LIELLFEAIAGSKNIELKGQKEDNAETKWRKWRLQRDEEIEARVKGVCGKGPYERVKIVDLNG